MSLEIRQDEKLVKMTINAVAGTQELGFVFLMFVLSPFPLSFLKFILPWSRCCAGCRTGIPGAAQSSPQPRGAICCPHALQAARADRCRQWPRPPMVLRACTCVYKASTFDPLCPSARSMSMVEAGREGKNSTMPALTRVYERTREVT